MKKYWLLLGGVTAFTLIVLLLSSSFWLPRTYTDVLTFSARPDFEKPFRELCAETQAGSSNRIVAQCTKRPEKSTLFQVVISAPNRESQNRDFDKIESPLRNGDYEIREVERITFYFRIMGLEFRYFLKIVFGFGLLFGIVAALCFIFAYLTAKTESKTPPPLPHKAAKFDEY